MYVLQQQKSNATAILSCANDVQLIAEVGSFKFESLTRPNHYEKAEL